MSYYTITISPDDNRRASTTLRVDFSESDPRVTELVVRAGSDAGLSAPAMPAVDMDLLLRAISPASRSTVKPAAKSAVKATPAAQPVNGGPSVAAESTTGANAGGDAKPSTGAGSGGRRRIAKASGRSRAAKSTKAAKAAEAEPAGRTVGRGRRGSASTRAYRRAPADLAEVYQRLGGVTALAGHYDVPRHTAQSWVRRLRAQGGLPES